MSKFAVGRGFGAAMMGEMTERRLDHRTGASCDASDGKPSIVDCEGGDSD